MPLVRIHKVNWERLKRWAIPLEDTVDNALNRVLNVAESMETTLEKDGSSHRPYACGEKQTVTGEYSTTERLSQRYPNENHLLEELEQWLLNQPRITLLHSKKTMNTYCLEIPIEPGKRQPKIFVPTNGLNRLYLPNRKYTPIDPEQRVIYKDYENSKGRKVGWNWYPQFTVKTTDDLEFAKVLVKFILDNS